MREAHSRSMRVTEECEKESWEVGCQRTHLDRETRGRMPYEATLGSAPSYL